MKKIIIFIGLLTLVLTTTIPAVTQSSWGNIETDKGIYSQRSPVRIYVINNAPYTVTYCQPTTYYITNEEGEVVYATISIAICKKQITLEKGEIGFIGVWYQIYKSSDIGEDNERVPPGRYFIHWGGDTEDIQITSRTRRYCGLVWKCPLKNK